MKRIANEAATNNSVEWSTIKDDEGVNQFLDIVIGR